MLMIELDDETARRLLALLRDGVTLKAQEWEGAHGNVLQARDALRHAESLTVHIENIVSPQMSKATQATSPEDLEHARQRAIDRALGRR